MNRRNLIKALALAPFVRAGVVKALEPEPVAPKVLLNTAIGTGAIGATSVIRSIQYIETASIYRAWRGGPMFYPIKGDDGGPLLWTTTPPPPKKRS